MTGHIKGAVNISLGTIRERPQFLIVVLLKDEKICIYDRQHK